MVVKAQSKKGERILGTMLNVDEALVLELYNDLDAVYSSYGLSDMERMWISNMYAIEKNSYITMKCYNKLNYGRWGLTHK